MLILSRRLLPSQMPGDFALQLYQHYVHDYFSRLPNATREQVRWFGNAQMPHLYLRHNRIEFQRGTWDTTSGTLTVLKSTGHVQLVKNRELV